MSAGFDRLTAWMRRHYAPAWLLCVAALIGIGLLDEPGWEAWVMELLTLPLNLLSWPLLPVCLQDRRADRKQGRSYPGFHVPSRLRLLHWVPAAMTTPAVLHLPASF